MTIFSFITKIYINPLHKAGIYFEKTSPTLYSPYIDSVRCFLVRQYKEAFAVTRGQLLHEIVNTLGIPKWEGKGHFVDIPPGHPYKAAAETALALGIILPSETFYPDIEATNAEALFFSLRAMGMRHEAKILRTLMQEKNTSDLPDYIFPYYIIAKTMSPKAPKALTSSPGETLTQPVLSLLKQWLRACMAGLVWEKTFQGKRSTLTLHRKIWALLLQVG